MGNTIQKLVSWDPYPIGDVPRFDPHMGFPAERKKRVMIAKEEDLIAAKVPKDRRDYCAHLYLDFLRCRRREFPIIQRCANEIHHYHRCQYDDFVLRMKEYERERRLLIREDDIKKRALKAAAA